MGNNFYNWVPQQNFKIFLKTINLITQTVCLIKCVISGSCFKMAATLCGKLFSRPGNYSVGVLICIRFKVSTVISVEIVKFWLFGQNIFSVTTIQICLPGQLATFKLSLQMANSKSSLRQLTPTLYLHLFVLQTLFSKAVLQH